MDKFDDRMVAARKGRSMLRTMRLSAGSIANTRKKNTLIQARAVASGWKEMRTAQMPTSKHTVLGTRVSNKCNWRYKFSDIQSWSFPSEVVFERRSCQVGFSVRTPVKTTIILSKSFLVIMGKLKVCTKWVDGKQLRNSGHTWGPSSFDPNIASNPSALRLGCLLEHNHLCLLQW